MIVNFVHELALTEEIGNSQQIVNPTFMYRPYSNTKIFAGPILGTLTWRGAGGSLTVSWYLQKVLFPPPLDGCDILESSRYRGLFIVGLIRSRSLYGHASVTTVIAEREAMAHFTGDKLT
jgi:hypothetical protein